LAYYTFLKVALDRIKELEGGIGKHKLRSYSSFCLTGEDDDFLLKPNVSEIDEELYNLLAAPVQARGEAGRKEE
jgi:hypothetical protein